MSVNERMREARKNVKLNQTEVAKELKITQEQYSLYETGKREMPLKKFRVFCQVCKVSADWLLEIDKQ